jgi:hypothetical protein
MTETRMTMTIGKCRGIRPTPDKVDIALVRDQNGVMQLAVVNDRKNVPKDEIAPRFHILKYVAKHGDPGIKKLMEEFSTGKSQLYAHVKKLRDERLLGGGEGPLSLTGSGHKRLADLWPGDMEL